MDFGSSHVYAGSPYYSDVPFEKAEPKRTDIIYEAVNEMYQHAEESSYDHSYDPVAFDSNQSERREYDLVPYEAGLDPANSVNISSSSKHSHPKRSLSSAVLHKAKKVGIWKKQKNKPSKSTSSISETDEVAPPPPPPPRKSIRNEPLPPTPNLVAVSNSYHKPLPHIPPVENISNQEITPPAIPPKPSSFKLKADQATPDRELANVLSYDTVSPAENSSLPDPLESSGPTLQSLYPALPSMYAEVNRKYETSEPLASAPPLQEDMGAQAPQQKKATAPALSRSMINRDTRSSNKNKPKNQYAAADTNVVSVKLGILEKGENSMVWAMPPSRCQSCQAILMHHAMLQNQTGVCRFCGFTNQDVADHVLPLVGNESDITYVLNQNAPIMIDDPIIVFCIDISGSMCVTSEVDAGFISRLQGVKDGIIMQIRRLRLSRPTVRVAIVTFSDLVVLYGDGSPEQYMALSDAQLYDTDYIKSTVDNMILPGHVSNTHGQLLKTVNILKEHGGTALGPALFLSVALASRKCGSQVIVCTDGRANVGVGSLELESDYKMCHNFYKETSDYGIQFGTMVSILSIEGTDCRLVELGKVADKTAGKVKIANLQTIEKEFEDIASSSLMATQVDVKMVAQKELYFDESKESRKNRVGSFVGNVTRDSEITFKYGIQESEQASPPKDALFQLQVRYLLKNGCTCLRVITQSRPVTENRILAEQGLNPAVVGTYASQLASKLVLDGDLRDAKLTTDAHKKLITRAMSIRSTRSEIISDDAKDKIYGSVCHHMDEINRDIKSVVESAKPSQPAASSSEVPPPLPPRPSESPLSLSRSSSMSSLSLPDVPNTPLATRERMKEAVEHCPDEVARKLYQHRAACGNMFAAC